MYLKLHWYERLRNEKEINVKETVKNFVYKDGLVRNNEYGRRKKYQY